MILTSVSELKDLWDQRTEETQKHDGCLDF